MQIIIILSWLKNQGKTIHPVKSHKRWLKDKRKMSIKKMDSAWVLVSVSVWRSSGAAILSFGWSRAAQVVDRLKVYEYIYSILLSPKAIQVAKVGLSELG